MEESKKCLRCEGEMEGGVIADTSPSSVLKAERWGTNISGLSIAGKGLKNARDVYTYRCKACGYLESYAK